MDPAWGLPFDRGNGDGAPDRITRVAVADGEEIFRAGLDYLLARETDLLVTASVSTGREALVSCASGTVDVLLMAWRLPDMPGPDLLKSLAEGPSRARALVLADPDQVSPAQAITAGAWGHLARTASAATVAQAIRGVAGGQIWAPREALATIIRGTSPPGTPGARRRPPSLSLREAQVLSLVAAGRTNGQIAEALVIEISTVKTHLVRAYRKLGISDRTAAVLAALSAGLIRTGK